MTLLTAYQASIEAQAEWARRCALLRVYYAVGSARFGGGWNSELGVRVDGTRTDPMDLLVLVVSIDMAFQHLRRCQPKAYCMAMHDVEEPNREYHNGRGTGTCDYLGLTILEGKELAQRAIECVHVQLETNCENCPFKA